MTNVKFTPEQKESGIEVQKSIEQAAIDKEIEDLLEASKNIKPIEDSIVKISMMPIPDKDIKQTDISNLRARLQEIQLEKRNLPVSLLKNFREVSDKIQKCVGRVA